MSTTMISVENIAGLVRQALETYAPDGRVKAHRPAMPLHSSCMNCEHFSETTEICGKHESRGRPPARIIANGCDDWYGFVDIPF